MGLNSFQTSGSSPTATRCQIALLGFGSLGAALARRLTGPDSPPGLQLTQIFDRRAREKRAREPEPVSGLAWTDRFDDLLTGDAHIVVEAVSGSETAADYVRAALLAGKSVVTVNTLVIARHGAALLTLAERQGRQLRYTGAVCGAMPIVRALADGLCGEKILAIDGVLDGTTNAVLSHMDATGCGLDDAIAHACALGHAEGNPSAGLDGADAAAKLSILCAIGLGVHVLPSRIDTHTTRHITAGDMHAARERGGTIRQLAHAAVDDAGVLTAWVAPQAIAAESPLARVAGAATAAVIRGRYAGEITLAGSGTGVDALAVAVLSDLVTIARDRAAIVPAPVLRDPAAVLGLLATSFGERKVVNIREAV